jgi:hypothetical protein
VSPAGRFHGAIFGDCQVWPAADRIALGCMRPRCASSLIAPMPKRTAVDRRARVLRPKSTASGSEAVHPPTWIKPQLTRLIDEAPTGKGWLHKYDGYRMHARIVGAIDDILKAVPPVNMAVIAHGGVAALLLCRLKGVPISRAEGARRSGGNFFVFRRDDRSLMQGLRPIDVAPTHFV